jgi:hypothetical protein
MWHHFAIGGLGDMGATLVSHPADVLKVRVQLLGERDAGRPSVGLRDYRNIAQQAVTSHGVRQGLYPGLSAALMRHSVFSTLRHGLYRVFEEEWSASGKEVTVYSRLGCAVVAGATAGFLANPADVVLIRMQADASLPASQRRGYRNAIDGMTRIVQEEGLRTLWRGVSPCMFRAVLVTSSQITTYGTTKSFLERKTGLQGFALNMASAMCSGTVACLVTSPVDVVKTRMMQAQGSSTYSGPLDCVVQTARTEGPRGFYKGLSATFLRLWPHTIMLWLVQERVDFALRTWQSSRIKASDVFASMPFVSGLMASER